MCPITNSVKGYPFEVLIPIDHEVSGAILSDQIRNLDWLARSAELICKAPDSVTKEVMDKVSTLILD